MSFLVLRQVVMLELEDVHLATNLSFLLLMGKHMFLLSSFPLLLSLSSLWFLGLLFPLCLFPLLASSSRSILSPAFLWLLGLLGLLFLSSLGLLGLLSLSSLGLLEPLFLPCPLLLLVSFSLPILSAFGLLLLSSFERPLLVFVLLPLPFSPPPAASSPLLTFPMLWVLWVEEVLQVLAVVVLLLAAELVGLLAVELARPFAVELVRLSVVELAGVLVVELAGPEVEVRLVVGASVVGELFAVVGQLEVVAEV